MNADFLLAANKKSYPKTKHGAVSPFLTAE